MCQDRSKIAVKWIAWGIYFQKILKALDQILLKILDTQLSGVTRTELSIKNIKKKGESTWKESIQKPI